MIDLDLLDAPEPTSDEHLRQALAWLREHGSGEQVKRLHGMFVSFHFGFIRQWARTHGMPKWSEEQVFEFEQELVAELLRRMPNYDPERGIPAITFVKKYWLPVKWRLAGNESPYQLGVTSKRLRTAVRQYFDVFSVEQGREPTFEEVAAGVSANSPTGAPVSAARVRQLLQPDVTVSLTQMIDGEEVTRDSLVDEGPTPEEHALLDEHRAAVSAQVALALGSLELSDVEQSVLVERLMAPEDERVSYRVLADKLGVRRRDLVEAEESVAARLRVALADLR